MSGMDGSGTENLLGSVSSGIQAQSPMVLSALQNQFVQHFTQSFSVIAGYASELFYILAGLEIVLFGLMWAIRQESALGLFVLKILKLGVIFFIITEFPLLLQAVIDGFTKAGVVVGGQDATKILFNPGHLWDYGFDASIALLKLSAAGSAGGLSNIYLLLGGGLILLFGLIGAQVILYVCGFYLVSLLSLLLIPLGAFFATKNFLERGIESVFRMGARVFALMVVLGIGGSVWGMFDLTTLISAADSLSGGIGMTAGAAPSGGNISAGGLTLMVPLGFFIATLVMTVLCIKLPSLVAEAVGKITGRLVDELEGGGPNSGGYESVGAGLSPVVSQVSAGSNLAASAMGVPGSGISSGGLSGVGMAASMTGGGLASSGLSSASQVNVSSNVTGGSATSGGNFLGGEMGDKKRRAQAGAEVQISRETLQKLKSTFKQVLSEKN